jgi:hypothetical protein
MPSDTLHIEVSTEQDRLNTIPNAIFFKAVPAALLQDISYIADSSDALVLGRQYFPLNDSITAFWVEISHLWFQHHSFLLYNKRRQVFTDRITLAEWYGGDGGQILTGSWVFDYDGDGKKDILRRQIQHSIEFTEGEPQEHTEELLTLLLWKKDRFVEKTVPDTAMILKRFPIRTLW